MWSNQPREDGTVSGGHMLICCVISSPRLLHLSPHLHLRPTLFPSKFGWDWKLLCDCQRWQNPCPTVLLSVCLSVCSFILCVWPCEGLSWGLNWAAVKHAGRMWSPHSCGIEGFQKGQKKVTKKILVVLLINLFSCLIFFPLQEWQSSLRWLSAQLLYALSKPYNMMTKPTNRMEDGRWNMHCTVLYWNILHEASILTIKTENIDIANMFHQQLMSDANLSMYSPFATLMTSSFFIYFAISALQRWSCCLFLKSSYKVQ